MRRELGLVLDELKREGYEDILVVDGHSTDRTVEIARSRGVKVVYQEGKGEKLISAYVRRLDLIIFDRFFLYGGSFDGLPLLLQY
ncbi:MAG: hypothetical protein QXP80_04660 [Zestosphaera sp.]